MQAVSDLTQLTAHAAEAGTMFILADLASKRGNVCETIAKLRADKATEHIPVIAFADESESALQDVARAGHQIFVKHEREWRCHAAMLCGGERDCKIISSRGQNDFVIAQA